MSSNKAEIIQREYERFVTGEDLQRLTSLSAKLNKRDGFDKLDTFAQKDGHTGKIGALFGLRRTGKTVLLHQLADQALKRGDKVAYAEYRYEQHDINAVIPAIEKLIKEGYKLILLDEITRTTGFYEQSMYLSDRALANIIIAGTESLALLWAMQDPLYGRTVTVKTTPMRYEEFHRLFPEKNIIQFLHYGGVIWETEVPSGVEEYLQTSVVENITRSVNLVSYNMQLLNRDRLSQIQPETLFRMLHVICEGAAKKKILSAMNSIEEVSAWKLTEAQTKSGVLLDDTGFTEIKAGLSTYYLPMEMDNLDEEDVFMLTKRLRDLGFLSETIELTDGLKPRHSLTITQPYIKRDFVRRVLSVFPGLYGTEQLITEKLESLTDGIMLEDVVYLEAMHRYHDSQSVVPRVVKYRDSDGREIDVMIYRPETKELILVEVKWGSDKIPSTTEHPGGQDRWLVNKELIEEIRSYYGVNLIAKIVLYQGATDTIANKNGVRWVNVEEWLLGRTQINLTPDTFS